MTYEDSAHLLRMLRAAGYSVKSWGGPVSAPREEHVVHFDEGGTATALPFSQVEAYLRKAKRVPSKEEMKIEELREQVQALAQRVSTTENQIAVLTRAVAATSEKRLFLCYVEMGRISGEGSTGVGWFTTDMDKQWGDDWNDAPYDCNAGLPYEWRPGTTTLRLPYLLVPVQWNLPPTSPAFADPAQMGRGDVSVQHINEGRLPWLYLDLEEKELRVLAGWSLRRFRKLVEGVGGTITIGLRETA